MAIHRPSNMSFTHSLAYLYLFMAHYGDSDGLTEDEMETIVEKIAEWNRQFTSSNASSRAVSAQEVRATWTYFCALTRAEEQSEFAIHASALCDNLSKPNRRAIVADMVAIAEADGEVTDAEKELVRIVYNALDID